MLRLPHLRSSPERSLRSACNRRTSAASRPGSGEETTLAKVVRNPPVSVSGTSIVRSSGTRPVGRRIATGFSKANLPRARPLCRQCDNGELVQGEWPFLRDRDSNGASAAQNDGPTVFAHASLAALIGGQQ